MSTAISEIGTAIEVTGGDLVPRVTDVPVTDPSDADDLDRAFATVPRACAPRALEVAPRRALDLAPRRTLDSVARRELDRRPRGARPPGGVVVYDRVPRTSASRSSRAAHPGELVEQARVGFAVLAMSALLSALVVTVLIVLAHLRAGDWGGESTPVTVPALVDVQSVPAADLSGVVPREAIPAPR